MSTRRCRPAWLRLYRRLNTHATSYVAVPHPAQRDPPPPPPTSPGRSQLQETVLLTTGLFVGLAGSSNSATEDIGVGEQ